MKRFLISLFIFLPTVVVAEPATTFTSPSQQTTLLELYTSEGCSSCPPADNWLSSLKNHPQLWKKIIPIAFHVDYWDHLGWKDPFARAEYSQRQRDYARFNRLRTVYTPGFLQNGEEWRSWFRHRSINAELGETVGRLEIIISGNTVAANFKPVKPTTGSLLLHVAWLGFDLLTAVHDGENAGKNLRHDFVSLGTQSIQGSVTDNIYHWSFTHKFHISKPANTQAAAFWVTRDNNPTPIQATGGWM